MAFREFQNVVKHTKKLPRRKSGIQSDFSLEKIFESFTVTDEQLYRLSLNSLSDRVKRFSTICCRSIATVAFTSSSQGSVKLQFWTPTTFAK